MSNIEWTDTTWNRLVALIDRRGPDECWPWTAGLFSNGYGQFRVGRRKVRAHRAYFEKVVGPVPAGKILCHSCDNPRCCNPAHLRVGTHGDNAADRSARGRDGRGFKRQSGEANGASRLKTADVAAIRAAHSAGESYRAIARRFGVSASQVGNIIRGDSWR